VGRALVYTLTVTHDHTFFVSSAWVLVHNASIGDVCPPVPGFDEEAAIASAQTALQRLVGQQRPINTTIAAAKQGPIMISGAKGIPGYEQHLETVLEEAPNLSLQFPAHAWDDTYPYYAKHAELYVAVTAPNEPIGVSGIPCPVCRANFRAIAASRGVPQVIADPRGVSIFLPNGFVKRIYNGGTTRVIFPNNTYQDFP
jgi:hypothetical protein